MSRHWSMAMDSLKADQIQANIERLKEEGRQAARKGSPRKPPDHYGSMERYRWWDGFCEIFPEIAHPYRDGTE